MGVRCVKLRDAKRHKSKPKNTSSYTQCCVLFFFTAAAAAAPVVVVLFQKNFFIDMHKMQAKTNTTLITF